MVGKLAAHRTEYTVLWAKYGGKIYITETYELHVDWFPTIGLPSHGLEYDRIVRGDLTLHLRDHEAIITMARNESERFIPNDVVHYLTRAYRLKGWRVEEKNPAYDLSGDSPYGSVFASNLDLGGIQNMVTEMMAHLQPGLPRPVIRIVNQTRSNWLGRCTWTYGKTPQGEGWLGHTTLIEIQKRVMVDETSLRRIVAHELCHHEDSLVNDAAELERLGYHTYRMLRRIRRNDHGPTWQAIAARFNAIYGPNFVTKTSDEDIVLDDSPVHPYYLLITRTGSGRWLYQVSVKLSEKQSMHLITKGTANYRLVRTQDPRFLRGKRIASPVWSVPNKNTYDFFSQMWEQPDIRNTDWGIQPTQKTSYRADVKPTADGRLFGTHEVDKNLQRLPLAEGEVSLEYQPGDDVTIKGFKGVYQRRSPHAGYPNFKRGAKSNRPKTVLWAKYQDKVYTTDKIDMHAYWFPEIGLPAYGPMYDKVIRGDMEINPDSKTVKFTMAKNTFTNFVPDDVMKQVMREYRVTGWKVEEPMYYGEAGDQTYVRGPEELEYKFGSMTNHWERLKRDMLAGIVYHGTTKEIAGLIQKEGFRGLEFDELLREVLTKWDKTPEKLSKKCVRLLDNLKRSYEGEHHLVSTSPAGEVATRWAGDGGEVPRQIEAYILGKYSVREVKDSRLGGEPAVVVARIKDFESSPYYDRAKRAVEGWTKMIGEGSKLTDHVYTEEDAFNDVWHEYTNYAVEPAQLEVMGVLSGAALEVLKQAPVIPGRKEQNA